MADLLEGSTPEALKNPVERTAAESNTGADENAPEQLLETKERVSEQSEDAPTTDVSKKIKKTSVASQAPGTRPVMQRDEVTIRVEEILEEGLGPLYATLPEEARPLFKKKGEEAATEISAMARSLKLEISKVVRLIRDWLLTIPKVNRFFLEQEAKIKTDAIIEYVEARKEDLMKQP